VLLIDRRPLIGGNAYDHANDAGLLVHRYGPHIFHTNSDAIFSYLSNFTGWMPYEHRVLAAVDGQLLPIPINLDTVNRLYGLSLTSEELEAFLARRAEPISPVRTAEDMVVSRVGRDLYEKFFRGYTRKQWGCDPSQLDKSVTARIPVRTSRDDRYFTDRYQYMPLAGYTAMFQRAARHPDIEVLLDTSFAEARLKGVRWRRLIFTGPIDEFFDLRFGPLPSRSLRFEHYTVSRAQWQPVAVVNYPQAEPYTRITSTSI
jgi:UDP-galactopyranose mutase